MILDVDIRQFITDNMDMVIWKDIPEYKNSYQVSSRGEIRSKTRKIFSADGKRFMKTETGKTRKIQLNVHGRPMIMLCKNGKMRSFEIHLLVAKVFIPKPTGKTEINHINGIKTDNRVENLEWVTRLENSQHAWKNGLINNRGENMGWAILTEKQVKDIKNKYKPGKNQQSRDGYSMYKLAKEYKVSYGAINAIVKNRNWRHV